MGQSISPNENYLFLNVMVNFVIVNQKLTGSALHIEKKSDYTQSQETGACLKTDIPRSTQNQGVRETGRLINAFDAICV